MVLVVADVEAHAELEGVAGADVGPAEPVNEGAVLLLALEHDDAESDADVVLEGLLHAELEGVPGADVGPAEPVTDDDKDFEATGEKEAAEEGEDSHEEDAPALTEPDAEARGLGELELAAVGVGVTYARFHTVPPESEKSSPPSAAMAGELLMAARVPSV